MNTHVKCFSWLKEDNPAHCMVYYLVLGYECLIFTTKRVDDGHCMARIIRKLCRDSPIDPETTVFYEFRTQAVHDPDSLESYWIRKLMLCFNAGGLVLTVMYIQDEVCSQRMLGAFLAGLDVILDEHRLPNQQPAETEPRGFPVVEYSLPGEPHVRRYAVYCVIEGKVCAFAALHAPNAHHVGHSAKIAEAIMRSNMRIAAHFDPYDIIFYDVTPVAMACCTRLTVRRISSSWEFDLELGLPSPPHLSELLAWGVYDRETRASRVAQKA